MYTGKPPVEHWCQYKQRPCEYANSWGKCLMTACAKHGDESLIYTTTTNTPTCNKKQVTSKLESVENATSEGEESTMGQPKSKLDCISRQDAIEALMAHFIPQTYTGEQVEQAEKLAQKIMNECPPVTPKPVMTEEVREALMRLTMCAREECTICKYENDCGFDKQEEMATENMHTILNAFVDPNCGADMRGGDTE